MNRPRLVRILRITWTGFWGLVALLLVVLWVRSYSFSASQTANLDAAKTWGGAIGSDSGEVSVCIVHMPIAFGPQDTWFYAVPYWYLLLLSPVFGVIPWLRWRFSISTLLLATTVIAVALGLGVWAVQWGL
jgi:hypothetical protein